MFLPSFVFVLGGALKRFVQETIQAFLARISAGVVGVIAVVSLDLIPEALVGWPSVVIFVAAFLLIVWAKLDVALVAIGAIAGGILYSFISSGT